MRPVALRMTGPSDGVVVRSSGIELRGRVTPGAAVIVDGEPASVSAGSFAARVPLDAGGNVIDVMASVHGMAPSMTAVRIVRQLTVRVPDVGGDSPADANDSLAAAGLHVRMHESGGLIDDLLPVDRVVCATSPDAGSIVDSGATIDVSVAKVC